MPEWAFVIQIVLCVAAQIARVFLVKPLIKLSIWGYVKHVVFPCVTVTITSSIIPIIAVYFLSENFITLVVVTILSVLSVLFSVFGLEKSEKDFLLLKLKKNDSD